MPSKSMSHRMAICALLAGNSKVKNLGRSQDITVTLGAMTALGWGDWRMEEDVLTTGDSSRGPGQAEVYCGESGSTLRFLIPLGLDGHPRRYTGSPRLLARSMEPYREIFADKGWHWRQDGEYISVQGEIRPGDYSLRGDVSSQFVSGLLFALSGLEGDSRIEMTGPVESRGYIDLTLSALEEYGISALWEGENRICLPGGQHWRSAVSVVEGDYSHAAFFLVAGALGGGVQFRGLRQDSEQGDRAIISILRGMGADLRLEGNDLVAHPSDLSGITIDAAQVPDLVPVLAVAACGAEGRTEIINAGRLRDKESDRLAAMAAELNALGGNVEERPEGLLIHGTQGLTGGVCNAHGDHRVAMSLAIAATLCSEPVILDGAQHVAKSAPQFWEEYKSLGGAAEELKG